jgi:hypothetical protein
MVTTLGISLYSYLYLKLAKTLFSLLTVRFSLQQNQQTRGQDRFAWKKVGEIIIYTHVNKCKNDKIILK